jgi:undecaprenyl pyrophosphate phosphatase UppP
MQFSRKNRTLFYALRMLESALVALLFSWVFILNTLDTLTMVAIALILTPFMYLISEKVREDEKKNQTD